MKTATRRKGYVEQVSGSVRWLRPLIVGKQLGRLSITNANGQATEYDLGVLTEGGKVVGYGLAKDDDDVYSIDASQPWGWTCDCGDCHFRSRECKHIRGVRAALARLQGGNVATLRKPVPSAPERPKCCRRCGHPLENHGGNGEFCPI